MTRRAPTTPARCLAFACAGLLFAGLAPLCARAAPRGIESAGELFRANRWRDARVHLRSHRSAIAESDRAVAQFLIGRSYVREAEFYRWVGWFANEVGLAYLQELADGSSSRELPWIPLFTGLHQLASGQDRAAELSLRQASASSALDPDWRAIARRRQAVARHRQGDRAATEILAADPSHEADYWRLVLMAAGGESPPANAAPAAAPNRAARAPRDWDRLWAACVLLRQGQRLQADVLLSELDPDRPSVEDRRQPKKVLRFFDPLALEALERVLWEQAVLSLKPLAAQGDEARAVLGAYYAALGLYRLGELDEARALLSSTPLPSALGRRERDAARVLSALASSEPAAGELMALWENAATGPESVVLWADLERPALSGLEPFATLLPRRMETLEQPRARGAQRAAAGRWGLLRLRAGADASELVAILSRVRDNANKNKIERNDPLLLLALAVANYRNADYAQSLETLFALSESFPGLRGLHWNVQGTYAARQTAGGEARISQ